MVGSSSVVVTGLGTQGVTLEQLSARVQISCRSSPSACTSAALGTSASSCSFRNDRQSDCTSSVSSEVAGAKLGRGYVGLVSSCRVKNRTQARAQTATCGHQTQGKLESQSKQLRTEETFYDLLGVDRCVSSKEVRVAYRRLARRFHPDVVPPQQREECTKNFLKIHSAYTTLSDPERKARYDLVLSMQRHQANGYGYSAPLSANWNRSTTSYYSAPSSFLSQWKGRSWETDQCW